MKPFFFRILCLLMMLTGFSASAQVGYVKSDFFTGQLSVGQMKSKLYADSSAWLQIGKDSTNRGVILPRVQHVSDIITTPGIVVFAYVYDSAQLCVFDGVRWRVAGGGSGGGGGSTFFNANRPITRNFTTLVGVNLGTMDIASTLEALLFPSQGPTAALTITYGGLTANTIGIEKIPDGTTIPLTINWTAGRQPSTQNISTIVVDGANQTFSNPAPSGSVSGTKSETIVANNATNFTNVVTTSDGKVASASASFGFFTKWYYGFVAPGITSPSDADIRGLTGNANFSRTQYPTNVPNSTSNKLVIAFESALDPSNVSEIWVGGLNSTAAFSRTVRTFVNASGYSSSYIVYIQVSPTASSVNFEIK